MFLGGDSPRKAANFGIPKRGNFGIPKWDFFLRADAPGFCRGAIGRLSDAFLSGSAASGRINYARLALLAKLEGRAFSQTDIQTADVLLLNARPAKRAAVGFHTPVSLAQERNRIPGQG